MGKMTRSTSEELARFYSIFPWYDDPWDEAGQRYFELTLGFMEKLINHPWIKELQGKERVRILEVCGGAGFGGVSLAKRFKERGTEVELAVTDLREEALERAARWGKEVLGEEVRARVLDAREVWRLGEKQDLVLMYGLSTPHFDPWGLVELFASVGEVLGKEGIFVLDESDRRYRIFLLMGYKWAMAEGRDENLCVSFHTDYSLYRGTCKRAYMRWAAASRPVYTETFMWGLAEVAAFMWCFFEEVDFLQLRNERHFLIGRRPRRRIRPGELERPPKLRQA